MDEIRELAGNADGWRKLVVDGLAASPVDLSRGRAVKLVDGERTEIVDAAAWPARLDALLEDATHVHLHGDERDLHARRTKKGRWLTSSGRPSAPAPADHAHDRKRSYPLPADHPLFAATKISGDKYRQVQHYLELLRPLPIWDKPSIRVVDAGCGKAYMSLALVAYGRLHDTRVDLVGLDANPRVIETVRGIAAGLGYDEARFEATAIEEFSTDEPIDLLVSLHACDTATDEAIAAGIRLDVDAIVVAPCCHRDLARQVQKNDSDAILRHGLLLGRQCDLVTDALRASALELYGYRADVMEFVAAEHTAKNVMIRAVKGGGSRERAAQEYAELVTRWDVVPALERMLGGELAQTRSRVS
jgi:SAM-dependent methyltransferase